MFDLFHSMRNFSQEELQVKNPEYAAEVEQYCKFLIDNRFVAPSLNKTIKMPLRFETMNSFNNEIIDVNEKFRSVYHYLFKEMKTLRWPHLSLRFGYETTNDDFFNILDSFLYKELLSVEIVLKYSDKLNLDSLQSRLFSFFPVSSLYVFEHPVEIINKDSHVFFLCESMNAYTCGNVHPAYFRLNNKLFTESQHFNTCLNKKICIDRQGNLKSCLYLDETAGKICDLKQGRSVDLAVLKRLWGIRKDDIDVCKDCEFRYMCTDCRAFIKDPENIYSQPAKCPYNPYIAKWEGEDAYITVERWRAENPLWEKKAKRKPLVKNPQPVE